MLTRVHQHGAYGDMTAISEFTSAIIPSLTEGISKVVTTFKPSEYQAVTAEIYRLEKQLGGMKKSAPGYGALQARIKELKAYRARLEEASGQAVDLLRAQADAALQQAQADEASAQWKMWAVGAAVVIPTVALAYYLVRS